MFKFTRQYAVFGRISNEQWEWLGRVVGPPLIQWRVSRGAVWFKDPGHQMLYILRWSK